MNNYRSYYNKNGFIFNFKYFAIFSSEFVHILQSVLRQVSFKFYLYYFFIYIFKPFSSFAFNHVTKICKTRIILTDPFTAQGLWFKKKNKETFLRKKIPQAWVLNKISNCCLHSIHASSRGIFVMNLDTTTSNQCMKIWLFSPSWAW